MTLRPLRNPYLMATAAVVLSAVLAPRFCYEFDVDHCWLRWASATGGWRPWRVYDVRGDAPCNYPPVLPYLWTATAAVRRLLPVLQRRWLTLELVKLPNVIAWAAGVPLCHLGLRRSWGAARARAAAVAYAVSVPLLFDAAVWGQYDAILSLAMMAAVVLLIANLPTAAGAAGGLALGIKFQAVVLGPVAAAYVWRRFGPATLARSAAAGAVVLAVVSAPFVIAGRGGPMMAAYTGAVDFYPRLTLNAANLWQPVRQWNLYVRHLPDASPGYRATTDAARWAGPVTPKRIGSALFAAYVLAVTAGVWRRDDGVTLARAAALSAFAFFMLPTQMHERYLVPAAVLAALTAGWARADRWLYAGLSLSAAAQLAVQQFHEAAVRTGTVHLALDEVPLAALTLLDVVLFAAATVWFADTLINGRIIVAESRPTATP